MSLSTKRTLIFFLLLIYSIIAVAIPETIKFPVEHGKHSQSSFEWWNFFGHMSDANQNVFGFSLTFFRQAVPPQQSSSQWIVDDIYISQFSITNSKKDKFYFQDKLNRTSFNFAGASDTDLLVWNRGWKVVADKGNIFLGATTKTASLNLRLLPIKPPLLFGENGSFVGNNLHYYALPKLQGDGELRIGKNKYQILTVSGGMDHSFLESDQISFRWDKFAIQLNNGDDILIYIFASKNNTSPHPESFCIIYHPDGTSERLKLADLQLKKLKSWYSKKSKVNYPSGWDLTIPALNYHLELTPTMSNQEIFTTQAVYWGGQSSATGEIDGSPVTGYAYVELSS